MTPYFILLLTIIFICLFADSKKDSLKLNGNSQSSKRLNTFVTYSTGIILILFSGFRFDVGSDWFPYFYIDHEDFIRMLEGSYVEYGWKLFGYSITAIWNRYGSIMFVASVITVGLYTKTISKYSENFFLSILLFFFLEYDNSFNAVRQYLAASILFAGHRNIYDGKLLKWCLIVLLAASFHTTAFLLLPAFFIINRPVDRKQIIFLLVFSLFTYFGYEYIFRFIGWYKGSNSDLALTDYAERSVNILRVLIQWIPVFVYFIFVHKKQKLFFDKKINFYANFLILCAVLATATSNSAYLGRSVAYFSCYLSLALPAILSRIESRKKYLLSGLLLILYGIFWWVNLMTHSSLHYSRTWLSL